MLKLITIISCLMIISSSSAMPSSANIESTELPSSANITEQQQQPEETQTIEPAREQEAKQIETIESTPISSSLPTLIYTGYLDTNHFFHPSGLRTIIRPETIRIHEPALAKIGDLVQRIPTAVSHQSQTIVHKHANVITPIVAPAVKTQTHQILRTYTTPLIYAPSSPYLQIIQEP